MKQTSKELAHEEWTRFLEMMTLGYAGEDVTIETVTIEIVGGDGSQTLVTVYRRPDQTGKM